MAQKLHGPVRGHQLEYTKFVRAAVVALLKLGGSKALSLVIRPYPREG